MSVDRCECGVENIIFSRPRAASSASRTVWAPPERGLSVASKKVVIRRGTMTKVDEACRPDATHVATRHRAHIARIPLAQPVARRAAHLRAHLGGYARIEPRLVPGAAGDRAQRRLRDVGQQSQPASGHSPLPPPPPPPPLLLLLPRRMSSPAPCGGGPPRRKDWLRCRAHHSMVSGRQRRGKAAGSRAVQRHRGGRATGEAGGPRGSASAAIASVTRAVRPCQISGGSGPRRKISSLSSVVGPHRRPARGAGGPIRLHQDRRERRRPPSTRSAPWLVPSIVTSDFWITPASWLRRRRPAPPLKNRRLRRACEKSGAVETCARLHAHREWFEGPFAPKRAPSCPTRSRARWARPAAPPAKRRPPLCHRA